MTNWSGGYGAEFALAKVDPKTWTASHVTMPIDTLSITRSCTDDVPMLESASIELTGDFENGWYEVEMITSGDTREKIPLGVFAFEQSASTDNFNSKIVSAQGFSVLKPADGSKLTTGEYAPMGADGAAYAGQILKRTLLAPVNVEASFTLNDNVIFGIGMSHLEAAWLILKAGNCCMQLQGDGTVNIIPLPSEPSLNLTKTNADLLIPGINTGFDTSDVKNRYYAMSDGLVAVAENKSNGSTSFDERGYWDDIIDTSPVRINGESLEAYAQRKLNEQAVVKKSLSYVREYEPNVYPYSLTQWNDENMRVVSQDLTCQYGITVSETVEMEVQV